MECLAAAWPVKFLQNSSRITDAYLHSHPPLTLDLQMKALVFYYVKSLRQVSPDFAKTCLCSLYMLHEGFLNHTVSHQILYKAKRDS